MPLSDDELKKCTLRLLTARLKLLNEYGFYGLLLMHTKFGLDESCPTAYTDGEYISFSPKFINDLTDKEIEFVLLHEVLHIVLKHCFRGLDYDQYLFNIACDIVVNSNILEQNKDDLSSITLTKYGEAMHKCPNGKEGRFYTAEEVYEMLLQDAKSNKSKQGDSFDDHTHWSKDQDKNHEKIAEWDSYLEQAYDESKNRPKNAGDMPLGIEREIGKLRNPLIDWKKMLNDFLSFEINDYSFSPPDRRFSDSGFFLPDYNVPEENELKVWFVADTSASISKEQITSVISEIKGALDQFDGKLKGYLSYFDSALYGPYPFDDKESLLKKKPLGGGGTSFNVIFNGLDDFEEKTGKLPEVIVIFTDGYCFYPKEDAARKIPVFWLINNEDSTPPWGIVARFK